MKFGVPGHRGSNRRGTSMSWGQTVRERARATLAIAASRNAPPPFTPAEEEPPPVVLVNQTPSSADVLPRGVRTAGAWAWRFILFVVAAYLVLRIVALLHIVLIPVAVAI